MPSLRGTLFRRVQPRYLVAETELKSGGGGAHILLWYTASVGHPQDEESGVSTMFDIIHSKKNNIKNILNPTTQHRSKWVLKFTFILPNSNWKTLGLVACANTAGNNLVLGSTWIMNKQKCILIKEITCMKQILLKMFFWMTIALLWKSIIIIIFLEWMIT